MKHKLVFVLILSVFISCNKSSNTPLLENWPQHWLLTADASSDKYVFFETAGNNMKRSEILKTYSLTALADEKECSFIVNPSHTEDGKDCYKMQFKKTPKRWLFVGMSSNLQEVHLGTSLGGSDINPPGDSDNYKFLVHKMPEVNGIKTVAIESVEKPGWYLSTASPGFNYSPTQAVLTQHSNPESAQKFQCR